MMTKTRWQLQLTALHKWHHCLPFPSFPLINLCTKNGGNKGGGDSYYLYPSPLYHLIMTDLIRSAVCNPITAIDREPECPTSSMQLLPAVKLLPKFQLLVKLAIVGVKPITEFRGILAAGK